MSTVVRASGYLQDVVLYAGVNVSVSVCFLLGQLQVKGKKLFSLPNVELFD